MVVSSVEVYPKECLGVLLGYRAWHSLDKTRRAIIEHAISYQTAERTRNTVEVKEKHELRCKDMLYRLCSLESIGDFHSHPDTTTSLTPADKKSMEAGNVEIVVATSEKKRTTPWRYNLSKKELSGVFGNYRFDVAAYSCFKLKNREVNFEKIHLICPFALGVGSKFIDTSDPFFSG
jgi:proteasome lid subunit RPN8/RPN11